METSDSAAAAASSSDSKLVRIKLLVDKNKQKVLFAEAGKDFVDLLFSLMSLPLGTVIALLTKNNMVGCLGDLYESIESLSITYLHPNYQNKDSILKPKPAIPTIDCQNPLLLPYSSNTSSSRKAYVCPNFRAGYSNHYYVGDVSNCVCPSCNNSMSTQLSYVDPPPEAPVKELDSSKSGGFVKGVITYMILDNLEVKPMSTISGITFLNKFNVQNLSSLDEKEIDIGLPEGLKLLKESLQSKNVLTNIFLQNKPVEA